MVYIPNGVVGKEVKMATRDFVFRIHIWKNTTDSCGENYTPWSQCTLLDFEFENGKVMGVVWLIIPIVR